jgi:hypothetical protein
LAGLFEKDGSGEWYVNKIYAQHWGEDKEPVPPQLEPSQETEQRVIGSPVDIASDEPKAIKPIQYRGIVNDYE